MLLFVTCRDSALEPAQGCLAGEGCPQSPWGHWAAPTCVCSWQEGPGAKAAPGAVCAEDSMAPSPWELREEPRAGCLSVLSVSSQVQVRTWGAGGDAGEQRPPHVLAPFPWHYEIWQQVKAELEPSLA